MGDTFRILCGVRQGGVLSPILFSLYYVDGVINKLVRSRWPYDMRPLALAAKYMCVIVIR